MEMGEILNLGLRYSLIYKEYITYSWIRSGDKLTTYPENLETSVIQTKHPKHSKICNGLY